MRGQTCRDGVPARRRPLLPQVLQALLSAREPVVRPRGSRLWISYFRSRTRRGSACCRRAARPRCRSGIPAGLRKPVGARARRGRELRYCVHSATVSRSENPSSGEARTTRPHTVDPDVGGRLELRAARGWPRCSRNISIGSRLQAQRSARPRGASCTLAVFHLPSSVAGGGTIP